MRSCEKFVQRTLGKIVSQMCEVVRSSYKRHWEKLCQRNEKLWAVNTGKRGWSLEFSNISPLSFTTFLFSQFINLHAILPTYLDSLLNILSFFFNTYHLSYINLSAYLLLANQPNGQEPLFTSLSISNTFHKSENFNCVELNNFKL